MRRGWGSLLAGAVVAFATQGSASAQVTPSDLRSSEVSEPGPAVDDGRVHVDLTPDLWGLSMKARGGFGGQTVAASIPLGSIIKHLDNLFLGEVGIRKGHLVALADVTHAAITLPGRAPLPGDYRLPISATFLTLGAGLTTGPMPVGRLGDREVTITATPFAGATYDDIDARVDAPTGTLGSLNPTWWSAMVGGRIDLARGRGSLRFEGYGAGFSHSRQGQQALASYAYRLHWHALRDPTLGGGYRYSHQRRVIGADSLDLKLQGPVVYMTFHL